MAVQNWINTKNWSMWTYHVNTSDDFYLEPYRYTKHALLRMSLIPLISYSPPSYFTTVHTTLCDGAALKQSTGSNFNIVLGTDANPAVV